LSSSSPRKQALRRQPRRERETSGEEEDGDVAKFCVLCDKLLPQNLATIVKMQVTLNKNPPGSGNIPGSINNSQLLVFPVADGVPFFKNHVFIANGSYFAAND
jgi:hypothetical protein